MGHKKSGRKGPKIFTPENTFLYGRWIGKPFRCHSWWNTAYPVFETQPFLAQLEQFALTDQGSHQFDVVRYLFGEAETIYSQIQTVNPTIKGEDVATSLIRMKNGVVVTQERTNNP